MAYASVKLYPAAVNSSLDYALGYLTEHRTILSYGYIQDKLQFLLLLAVSQFGLRTVYVYVSSDSLLYGGFQTQLGWVSSSGIIPALGQANMGFFPSSLFSSLVFALC